MNIFKKCSICGEILRLHRHEEYKFEEHFKEKHPNEYQEIMKLTNEYDSKLYELDKLYDKQNVYRWFVDADAKEWKKNQPPKPRPMEELFARMKEGWEVGILNNWKGTCICAQKNGIGHGGESKNYSETIINALIKRGLIEHIHTKEFPLIGRFILTEKGKKEESVCKVKVNG